MSFHHKLYTGRTAPFAVIGFCTEFKCIFTRLQRGKFKSSIFCLRPGGIGFKLVSVRYIFILKIYCTVIEGNVVVVGIEYVVLLIQINLNLIVHYRGNKYLRRFIYGKWFAV